LARKDRGVHTELLMTAFNYPIFRLLQHQTLRSWLTAKLQLGNLTIWPQCLTTRPECASGVKKVPRTGHEYRTWQQITWLGEWHMGQKIEQRGVDPELATWSSVMSANADSATMPDLRSFDLAKRVLVSVRRCGIGEAFAELLACAEQRGVDVFGLSRALVALSEGNEAPPGCDAAVAARTAWGDLFPSRPVQPRGVMYVADIPNVQSLQMSG
jgi:hypothetical protein